MGKRDGVYIDWRLEDHESGGSGGHQDLELCRQNSADDGPVELLFILTWLLILIAKFNNFIC